MTPLRKEIIQLLLDGHLISAAGRRFRIRDRAGNPVKNISGRNFWWLKSWDLLRPTRHGFAINRSKARQWHGNSFVKRAYKGTARGPDKVKLPPPLLKRREMPPGAVQSSLF